MRTTIPPRSNFIVLILGSRYYLLRLPQDYNFIFKPETLNALLLYTYIVNAIISYIFVYNNTNSPVVLTRNQALSKVIEYKLAGYFPVNPNSEGLVSKPPAKITRQVRFSIRSLLTTTAAFTVIVSSLLLRQVNKALNTLPIKVYYPTGVIIYGTVPQVAVLITTVINKFPNLQKDIGNVISIPKL